MISNERPSPYGRRPYQSQGYGAPKYHSQPRPPVNEDTLKSGEVQIERKNFVFTLKENPRGRFSASPRMWADGATPSSFLPPGWKILRNFWMKW